MDRMTDDLQRMIRALEALSEQPADVTEQIDELLDQLFQQKIDLVGVSLNTTSPIYKQAAQNMAAAANKVERAAKDPSGVVAMVPSIEEAIGRVAKLLNTVVPSS